MTMRIHGAGLYYTILPRANRVDDLRATHRDANPLPAVPDSQRTGEAILRRALKAPTAAEVARELDRKLAVRR